MERDFVAVKDDTMFGFKRGKKKAVVLEPAINRMRISDQLNPDHERHNGFRYHKEGPLWYSSNVDNVIDDKELGPVFEEYCKKVLSIENFYF